MCVELTQERVNAVGKNKVSIKNIIQLQAVIIIYTISSVMAKFASASNGEPMKFILFFGMEFVFLGIYALLWQQMIKKFELSVAYANRSMALLWSMIWAVIFFHDRITVKNIIGVILVMVGTIIINTEKIQTPEDDSPKTMEEQKKYD